MRFGIDLGGTKIEIVGIDDATGEVVHRDRVATDNSSYEANIKNMAKLFSAAKLTAGRGGTLGLATPGAISLEDGLLYGGNANLTGHPVNSDLAKLCGQEVRIANDANCFALSEASDGAAAGLGIVAGVIVGTGVGAGIVVNGQVVNGANSIAGEFGHNALPEPKPDEVTDQTCSCGRSQCIDRWVSGPSFARTFKTATGNDSQPAEIIELVRNGDNEARQEFSKYVDRLARALGSIINVIDPHAIVLGGGMSNITELYTAVPDVWDKYIYRPTATRTKLLKNTHGDSSGVRGAAWLWSIEESAAFQ